VRARSGLMLFITATPGFRQGANSLGCLRRDPPFRGYLDLEIRNVGEPSEGDDSSFEIASAVFKLLREFLKLLLLLLIEDCQQLVVHLGS
jgi:hypothetical protein